MSVHSALSAYTPLRRTLARLRGEDAGPLLLVVGGIHGNEPAGALAAIRFFGRLRDAGTPLSGDVVALSGNRGALAQGRRYVSRDLNRGWTEEALAAVRRPDEDVAAAEDAEQRELAAAIDEAVAAARGPVYFLDLHTTSADGVPFALVDDHPQVLRFALGFGLPVLLGLLEAIGRTLLTHLSAGGAISVGIEGGQNESPRSVEHHEAALAIAAASAGIVRPEHLPGPGLDAARSLLQAARGTLPQVLEVRHRHAIGPEDAFRMEPGFANIHGVRKGDLLARDRNGEIRARDDGYVVMPLYQAVGDEGFFFGRPSSRTGG